jgi:hypothetical protein
MINGPESRGELIAVKAESLVVKEAESGSALSLKIDEINSVKVVHKPQTLKWTLLDAATCGIAFPVGAGTPSQDVPDRVKKPFRVG